MKLKELNWVNLQALEDNKMKNITGGGYWTCEVTSISGIVPIVDWTYHGPSDGMITVEQEVE